MKNTYVKILSTAAVVLTMAFSFISCSGGGDKGGGNNNTPSPVIATGVTLDKKSMTLNIGAQDTLTATVQPLNATNRNVTWTSSHTNIATVNANGIVTGISQGMSRITATTADNRHSDYCDVTVNQTDVVIKETKTIATGYLHTVVIKPDGSLWGWGNYGGDTLDQGNTTWSNTPVRIGNDTDWATVSAGDNTMAIKSDGSLWTWGSNYNCALGIGTDYNVIDYLSAPTRVGRDTNWATIPVSGGAGFAIKTDGSLWAWGANGSGQLGLGYEYHWQQSTPVRVGEENNWLAISRSDHVIALKSDGSLWAWGWNFSGQVGDGTGNDSYVPKRIW
ncbi:MAG: Ig-like domain-containing protein [Holophagaceae bacterium]|nr:Ig-like domain-containing protein [Holophagaceae bacterium]